MCTEFHINTCKYVWATHQVFWWCSRGRRRASVPRLGPSLSGVLTAAGSNMCANFQEFLTMLSPPKMPSCWVLDFIPGDFFCRYCYVTWVCRFSYMYVKRSLRALRWISIGGSVEPFCHTYFWNPYSDVFRPGFLSNMWSLGQIEHCMAELQQLLFPWRDIEIWQDATDTPLPWKL